MMNILLIDDDEGLLDNFSLIISYKRPQTKISLASNGREALALVEQNKFDLIISDIKMPQLDGFQLKNELNKRGITIPTVFMTGLMLVDASLIGRQLGAIGFLNKPLTGDELVAAIDRAEEYNQRIKPRQEYLNPVAELVIASEGRSVVKQLSADYTIGRSPDADIRLTSNKASREHALLNRTAESLAALTSCQSHYRLIDYSRNGLEVNGQKVRAYAMLYHGDTLKFPECTMKYCVLDRQQPANPLATSS